MMLNSDKNLNPADQKRIEKTSKGIFGYFVNRTRLTGLILAAIVLLGGLAITEIPRESDPEVKIPIAVVSTFYNGASPADIENLVTDKIETKIEDLENVKLVTSNSVSSMSSVVVEFEASADLEKSIDDLKSKVDEVRNLPDEAEDPVVTEIRANDFPIISFSMAGDLNEVQLKELAETVQAELEKIPGMSEARISGTRSREFAVNVDRGALDRLGLSLNMVSGIISSANNDLPLGEINIDHINYNIRTVAKYDSLESLKKTVIAEVGGRTVLLEDIAEVTDDFSERHSVSRISIDRAQATDTVTLSIYKKTGGNILKIVDQSKAKILELQDSKIIPENVQVEISSDYSVFIRKDLNILGRSALQAVALIFVVMFLALSFKEALISLMAIPMTFLIAFFFLNAMGNTLNSLVLFTLVLSLGLLVDTFIVILEGIFHNMRKGYTAREASLLSISHYQKPLFAGVFTTVSAFVPMLLVSGIMGEYLKVLPITISITLLSSLFVTFVIVPSMAGLILKKKNVSDTKKESLLEKYLTNALRERYRKSVSSFLKNKKKKVRFTTVMVLMFVGALGLLGSGTIPVEMFPKVDVDFSFVDIEMPVGSDLETTNEVVKQVENVLYQIPEVKTFVTTIGNTSGGFGWGSSSSGDNYANINITFVDAKERDIKSFAINDKIRDGIKHIKEGKIKVEEISSGPPTGSPIEIRISGHDLDKLDNLATEVMGIMSDVDGVIDIESNQEVSPADLVFTLDKNALALYGLNAPEVSMALRTAIFGVEATEININNEDVDVIVRMDKEAVDTIEEVKNLSVVTARGESVKLAQLADLSFEPALSTIRHRDFERTLSIKANLETGFVASVVMPEVEKKIVEKNIIPNDYTIAFGGEVEDIEQSFRDLWNALIVAVLLIIFILVLQFNSFRKPLVIMFELPLVLIGVVIGMLFFNLPFSFSIFLGLVSLTGIVVNDAIVLLDKANRNLTEKNMLPREAIVDAGDSRLQPILLTSITTIIGIIPLAFADEFWVGLSISIMFGLAFATVLQLYVVPMVFLKFEGKGILKQKTRNK